MEFKEIYRDEDNVLCKSISMSKEGIFAIRAEFAEKYGGGELINYIGQTELKAMVKASEELNAEKAKITACEDV